MSSRFALVAVGLVGCGGLAALPSAVDRPVGTATMADSSVPATASSPPEATSPDPTLALVVDDPCQNPCALAAVASADVATVRYEADGWLLGEATGDGFDLVYTFNTVGARRIAAIGLDPSGTELVRDERTVEVLPVPSSVPTLPYFYQYDNDLDPSATCQNTSIAMVLAGFGWTGEPDDITAVWGKDYAQSPAGLAEVFNAEAEDAGIPDRLVPHTDGTIAGFRDLLDEGKPVIVHGMFTGAGHVLVALAYDDDGYVVNDPAGAWLEAFEAGYPSTYAPTAGEAVHYPTAAFELAISSLDGVTFEPLWYHELD